MRVSPAGAMCPSKQASSVTARAYSSSPCTTRPPLQSFDKPALVLWAEDDKIFPRDHRRLLAELLPQGRFEFVPDSRTFIPEDQPDLLASRVRAFLG